MIYLFSYGEMLLLKIADRCEQLRNSWNGEYGAALDAKKLGSRMFRKTIGTHHFFFWLNTIPNYTLFKVEV
jgi:hypothetical protein